MTLLQGLAIVCFASATLAGCEDYHSKAVEGAHCRDYSVSTASIVSHFYCPRADQRLSFEKDSDGDAYYVCRCVGGAP
jgi:hypothetical protein